MMRGLVFVGAAATAVLLLWLADLVLQPVPAPAGGAVVGGLLGVWLSRRSVWLWAGAGTALGLIAGAGFHLGVHLTGRSPAPAEGLAWHVIADGLTGLAVALVVLPVILFLKMATVGLNSGERASNR